MSQSQNILSPEACDAGKTSETSMFETEAAFVTPDEVYFFTPVPDITCKLVCDKWGIPFFSKNGGEAALHNIGEKLSSTPQVSGVIRGDGHCFYRSIAHLLCGDQTRYSIVRNEVFNFIRRNFRQLHPILPEGVTGVQYLKQREGLGTYSLWATEVHIYALAKLLRIDVMVFVPRKERRDPSTGVVSVVEAGGWQRFLASNRKSTHAFHLAQNHCRDHYDVVTRPTRLPRKNIHPKQGDDIMYTR